MHRRRSRFSLSRRGRWTVIILALLSTLALVASAGGVVNAQSTPDWPQFMFGPGHTSYSSAATSISTTNIANLQPVWRWSVPPSQNSGSNGLYATPVSVAGVLYIGADDGNFYAVNESTGSVIWSQFLGLVPALECSKFPMGVLSTATVTTDPSTGQLAVYVNAPDGHLYALDAATGNVLWKQVVGIPSSTKNDYFAWGSPLVANGNVYVGISSNCDNPLVPAGVLGFNAGTGSALGEWHSLPNNETGASVWSTPALLPDGSIIVTTGNGPGAGAAPYADSIVRLNGSNLGLMDSWEVPSSQQVSDGDFGGSATVFTADLNGTNTEMVGACDKNGIYYALQADNLSAGPVWQHIINKPYTGAGGLCVAGAIWDGTRLIEGAGDQTTIGGTTYQGGVYALDPATGNVDWATGLPGEIVGSPTEDGSGVVAAQVWASSTNNYGIYLLSASTGAILGYIPLAQNRIFGQPVFAGNDLLVDGLNSFVGVTAYQITTPGSPITAVSPVRIGQGATETLTLTGSGFSGTPTVFVSSTLVQVDSVQVVSPTTLSVTVTAASNANPGGRDITVIEPGPIADTCSNSNCLIVERAPTVSSANPNSIPVGDTASVTITGNYFQSGATVSGPSGTQFTGTKFVSSTQLTTQATIATSVVPGTYNLTVTNPDGGTGQCTGCLTVTADSAPTLTSVSPGAVGQQSTVTLNLSGTNFTTNSSVTFSASGVTVKSQRYVSPGSLSVTVGVNGSATLGAGNVTITTPGGSGTCSGCLTIDPHPAVNKLSPNSIANGTSIQIAVTGTNFVSGFKVTTTIPGATVGTPTNVTSKSFDVMVTVPAGTATGSYLLKVINPDGGTGSNTLSVT
jgi:outer membrane protein assembly factor BamB